MIGLRTALLTMLAMMAFAANSILCRFALKNSAIDPSSFTTIRLASGALTLVMLMWLRSGIRKPEGNWTSAAALFGYAAAFSFAYVSLSAGTGALILFGAVQTTMLLTGFSQGERFNLSQGAGLVIAMAGMVALVLPGLTAPPLLGASLMAGAGVAWGIYSLKGRGSSDPLSATAGNFIRALPFTIVLFVVMFRLVEWDAKGALYAVLSGAIASGCGYVIWYAALKGLSASFAATVQLSVPIIAALGGVLFLQEPITIRLALCSVAILGGIYLVLTRK